MSAYDGFLTGFTVLEIGSGVALSCTGLLLADGGARVVKLELPEGDHLRGEPPHVGHTGAVFASLNRGKQSLALDWRTEAGAAVLSKLLDKADVVLENVGEEELKRLETILERHDSLVCASISAFGSDGPMAHQPGSELVVQAMSSYTAPVGVFGEEPNRVGADVAEMNTALYTAIGVLAALYERCDTNQGSKLETSMLGTLLHMRSITWAALTDPDDWSGFHLEGQYWPPATAYKTADGQAYFTLHRGSSEDWDKLLIELDMLDVMGDPRFGDFGRGATGTGASDPEVKARFEQAFAAKNTEDLLGLLRSLGSNAIPFNDYRHLLADKHAVELRLGSLRMSDGQPALASPWMGDREPSQAEMEPHLGVPSLGQDSRQILKELGLAGAEVTSLEQSDVVRL
ncbi:MAG TPA: CaiB/BaiF CoA-transferase family protein [Dehalococcoidia bacterium]|nr:CaiB/BaiF CoA-transferase family protein [Dehalococcoidia bacterium]